MTALEFSGVSKRFGERYALRGVSFALPAGSALGLLGPNGAGKTTALRLLLGFTAPSEGAVWVGGLPPANPDSRIGVAYLPESLKLPARTSVRSFLRLHATLAGLAGADIDREVDGVLEQTGIAGQLVYRLVPFLAGLANPWLAYALARRLWPDDALRVGLAVGIAGLLPVNLYMAAYVSNEPLHAAWVSLALLLATRLILASRDDRGAWIGLASCLGAALLTKYTSVLLAPLIAASSDASVRFTACTGRSSASPANNQPGTTGSTYTGSAVSKVCTTPA